MDVTITEGTTDAMELKALINIRDSESDGEEDVFTLTVVQTQKHITKYFKRKRQGQKKVKEGNKTPYVSRNNPDPDDPDDPPEVTESETDPDTKHSDQKMNMEESLSLSQKVSDDPPGEVTKSLKRIQSQSTATRRRTWRSLLMRILCQ